MDFENEPDEGRTSHRSGLRLTFTVKRELLFVSNVKQHKRRSTNPQTDLSCSSLYSITTKTIAKANTMNTIQWIEASKSPWGVRVLDVRPVTLTMMSSSRDPQLAANAVSFRGEDGTCFIDNPVSSSTSISVANAGLAYKTDGILADGTLFTPSVMEEKWAVFYHNKQILFVRSWTRQVKVVASVEQLDDSTIEIREIRGTFGVQDETTELTTRMVDFVLQTHVLDKVHPAPLTAAALSDSQKAAFNCMSLFGKRALFAVLYTDPIKKPTDVGDGTPMRSHSLVHIAVARGDLEAVKSYLKDGMSADLLAGDGLSLLHWSLALKDPRPMIHLLLQHRANVDVPSFPEQATPLMNATQSKLLDIAEYLLDNGADVNASDKRGFTSLHRACEMGSTEMVKLLLARGADAAVEGEGGHTPLSLAKMRKETGIVRLLEANVAA